MVSDSNPTPGSLPSALRRGIEQFNQGDYYACHDTLEAIWMDAETFEKPFYQGILQIAVGFYHLSRENRNGAAILLGEGSSRLRRFEPEHEGVAVADLVDQALVWLALLQSESADVTALSSAIAQRRPVETSEGPLPLPQISVQTA
ncbi:DUF309 domain-containing protein [Romeria aff. gracilis LEGE 07310]|uniref:DUF309 domain-containing protein n=1 Tax=Vasconcelosia minhoensis LEGE 07310 TaxID=915328 RepID=A0A8J7DS56_9CYAN|nr:DUF309 domain-containing protein [Romeria gracilis]MBE9079729.1 DUF309 domain-containing protein [Romeria aff. gracilis LEGE 07310]